MIIVLNGPLGIGKSTLAEALAESIQDCVMLDGDSLVAANPAYQDEIEHLHSTVALLVLHHRGFGYQNFIINHIWRSPAELDDLRRRLVGIDPDIRIFLLTLSARENMRRVERRADARESDELDWERQTVGEERAALAENTDGIGEPFDVADPPTVLVQRMLLRLYFIASEY